MQVQCRPHNNWIQAYKLEDMSSKILKLDTGIQVRVYIIKILASSIYKKYLYQSYFTVFLLNYMFIFI